VHDCDVVAAPRGMLPGGTGRHCPFDRRWEVADCGTWEVAWERAASGTAEESHATASATATTAAAVTMEMLDSGPTPRMIWRDAATAAAAAADAAIMVAEGSWPEDPRWPPYAMSYDAETIYNDWDSRSLVSASQPPSEVGKVVAMIVAKVVLMANEADDDETIVQLDAAFNVFQHGGGCCFSGSSTGCCFSREEATVVLGAIRKDERDCIREGCRETGCAACDPEGCGETGCATCIPALVFASWEERARGLATDPPADVDVATPPIMGSQWARHMLVLSCLTDQYCRGVVEQWSIGPLVFVEGTYYRLRRIQCKLLAMSAAERSVLEMCASDVEGAMRRNAEAYSQTQRAEMRAKDTARRARYRAGRKKGGKVVVLPACDATYRCVLCPSDAPYVGSSPEQLRSHMRRKHSKSVEAGRGRYRGRERNVDGARQYALCVCAGACCVAGTEDWVRAPAAQEWQAALGL
jgi:hypothetical protein